MIALEVDNLIRDLIASKYPDAYTTKCCEKGQIIDMHNFHNEFAILKGELLVKKNQSICDCIILIDDPSLTICLVELKTAHCSFSNLQSKFDNSLKKLYEILKQIDYTRDDYSVYIILAHDGIRGPHIQKLRRTIQIDMGGTIRSLRVMTYQELLSNKIPTQV